MALPPYFGHISAVLPVGNNSVFTGSQNTAIGYQAGTNMKAEIIEGCMSCKEPYDSKHTYLTYHGSHLPRHVCNKCQIKALDKFYGIDINADLEDVLFEKK